MNIYIVLAFLVAGVVIALVINHFSEAAKIRRALRRAPQVPIAEARPSEAGSGYRDVAKRLTIQPRPDGPVLASDEPGTI